MSSKIFTTIFLVVFIATADWYVNTAEAKFITKDLVSLWTFDKADIEGKTVKDFWGNNDGEIKGAPQIVKGNIGEALKFDGVKDWVEIPSDPSLDFKDNSVTLTVWIKPHGGEDNWILYDGNGSRAAYALVHDDRGHADTFGVSFWNTAGVRVNFFGNGKFKHPSDEWYYVVGLLDDDKVKLYVNGKFEKETDFEGKIRQNTQDPIHIARYGFADNYFVDGTIDEIGIYARALTDAEIEANYKAKSPTADIRAAGKLSACWGAIKKGK
ncbi:TPA: LamG domain-containing protein [Candidatus Poribacteria bacterium]|nr:LamG domain-containing protein [Candidatus Poribacteria bacterium]